MVKGGESLVEMEQTLFCKFIQNLIIPKAWPMDKFLVHGRLPQNPDQLQRYSLVIKMT